MPSAAVDTIPPAPVPAQVQGWTFTQGLLFGQASFVVLCLLFVRYVVFQPAEDVDQDEWKRRRDERRTVRPRHSSPDQVSVADDMV